MTPTAQTRVITLLGDPIGHSASPEIQNAAFEDAGVDGVYVAVRCGPDDLQGFMRGLARAGGGGNVTLPHKEKAASLLDVRSEAVRRTGACNTFWSDDDGRLHGDNTDVEGFRRALRHFLGEGGRDARVLLLGGGGAARAALCGLLEEEVDEVLLYNRTQDRARAVARRIGGERTRLVSVFRDLENEDFDLVVNATSLGLREDDPSPIDIGEMLHRVGAAMDLVYGRHTTAFVQSAELAGVRACDGLEMLVQQGAVSFERWWGVDAPVDVMRRAVQRLQPA